MVYYIYSAKSKDFIEENKKLVNQHLSVEHSAIHYVSFEMLDVTQMSDVSHLLVTGNLDEIKIIMDIAYKNNLTLGIIPLPEQKQLIRTFNLASRLEESIVQSLLTSEKKIDLLYCNGSIVLQEVVVGNAPPLAQFDSILEDKTYFARVKIFLATMKKVKELKHTQMKMTDAKKNEIKLSAVGVVGVEYNNATFAAKLVYPHLSPNDGKVSIVILSPTSLIQYMGYLFKSLVSHLTPKTLPSSVGYIRSAKINIETQRPLDVLIDSKIEKQTPIELEVKEKALALSVGKKFWEKQGDTQNVKNSIKIDHLPSDEASANYLSKGLPLFSHASQEQYAALFKTLREESKLSQSFMVLLILATMIATFGLFINSSAVIIGAMLLAPLMQPIVSLSMGVLRQDEALLINGFKTITIGVLSVLISATVITFFTPIEILTSEMSGRLSPTILDLFVAMVSGIAAAYAKSNEKILGSLAGVAIAVSLVPPIAVAGIGLGWGDWDVFSTAFLLFITNLVGIVLAAASTFVLLGFSPLHLAKKGIMIWMIIVAVVAIPLYSSFSKMKEDIHIQEILLNLEFSLGEHDVKITEVDLVHRKKVDEVRCEVIVTGVLKKEEKLRLKEAILKSIGIEADVIATIRYRL